MGAHAPIYLKICELTVQQCMEKCKCPTVYDVLLNLNALLVE